MAVVFAAACCVFPGGIAIAQDTTSPTGPAAAPLVDPASGQLAAFSTLFNTSPIINSLILALSVVALLLFLYFLLTIRTAVLAPATLVDDLTKLIVAGRFDEAASVCRNHHRVFLASVVQRCVENAGKEHSVILDMIDSEGRRRADIVWNRISYLADVSNVAPMLGLLGTVIGMIKAFASMKFEAVSAASGVLTDSIGQAMSTTMFGLIVAILALIFYAVVKGRTTRTLADVEQIVHSLADHVKRGRA